MLLLPIPLRFSTSPCSPSAMWLLLSSCFILSKDREGKLWQIYLVLFKDPGIPFFVAVIAWEEERDVELWDSSHCNQKCLCSEGCKSCWQQPACSTDLLFHASKKQLIPEQCAKQTKKLIDEKQPLTVSLSPSLRHMSKRRQNLVKSALISVTVN